MAFPTKSRGADRLFRLAGEDAPVWPGALAATLGLALALTAGAQIFATPPPLPPAAPIVDSATPVVAGPAARPPETAPVAERTPVVAPAATVSLFARSVQVFPPDIAPAAPDVAASPQAGRPGESARPNASPAAAATAPCQPVVSVPFDLNSARFKTRGLEAAIAPLRDWLLAHGDSVLSVEGHADSRGAETYNVLLSFSRAQAVSAWLARAGVPAARVATRAAGTRQPSVASPNGTTNRRVILSIEGVAPCRDGGGSARSL